MQELIDGEENIDSYELQRTLFTLKHYKLCSKRLEYGEKRKLPIKDGIQNFG